MSQHEQWQISGNAPEAYERSMVPTLFTPWATDLVERLSLHAGEHVLDVACGTGIGARLAAHRVSPGGTVTGLDLNPGMLAVARSLPHATDVRIAWRQGRAVALPFANVMFNVVLCQQGLQFFPDRVAALRSLLRQAGFREVHIALAILVMRFAAVEAFVPGQFAATPYAGAVAALDAHARTALLEDVRMALRSYTDATGVAVPTEAHVAMAQT